MTPRKLTMIADFATAVAQHRGRTILPIREGGPFDGRAITPRDQDGFRTEHAIADPPEYPVLVHDDTPDTRDVPDEEYQPEPDPFDRDEYWWRRTSR